MIKIAVLTERIKEGFGVDLVVVEQTKRLLKNNPNIQVFAIEVDDVYAKRSNIICEKISIPLIFNPIKQDINSLKFLKNNYQRFAKFDTFIIHTPTFNSWIPILRFLGKKIIVCYYGNSPSSSYSGFKRFRKNIYDILENYIYFQFANKILPISNFLKKSLLNNLQKKSFTVYLSGNHVININKKINIEKRKKILTNFYISDKDKLICYIGRLDYRINPYKGTKELFQLQKLVKDIPNTKIFAIGYPENNIEQEMYDAGICVVPMATAEELVTILSYSYVYISPSKWEGFNLPLLESQSLGVPGIAYNIGAHSEVLGDKSGYLVDSYVDFEKKLVNLLSDVEMRSKMSSNAKIHSSNFSWKRNAEEVERHL